jgi:hypothetical protein
LAAPAPILQLSKWEREAANEQLYQRKLGIEPTVSDKPTTAKTQVLDVSEVLPPEEIRRRTGFTEAFKLSEVGDLPRTPFYHAILLEAPTEQQGLYYRVWLDPPDGLDAVEETFEATLPGVKTSTEIGDKTWLYETDELRIVAFLDRERNVALFLGCGVAQCVDIETAIILAKYAHDHIDQAKLIEVEAPAPRPATEPAGESATPPASRPATPGVAAPDEPGRTVPPAGPAGQREGERVRPPSSSRPPSTPRDEPVPSPLNPLGEPPPSPSTKPIPTPTKRPEERSQNSGTR